MTANLTIPLQGAENVIAVPLAAVFTEQAERFAYVKRGDKFERVPIKIGVTDYDYAEVTSGLEGGETVSLVTPAEEAGKVQQAFGAAAKGGRGGGAVGEATGTSGQGAPAAGPGGRRSGGGERRGPSAGSERRGPSGGGERRGPSGS
jgi:multidrug efflux pump subunit AcrA (membrane-fusion protein)